jgi:protein-L-isoaspartate O-methyltransferase
MKIPRTALRVASLLVVFSSVVWCQEPEGGATKSASPAKKAQRPTHRHTDRTYMGREIAEIMSFAGAEWLVRPERIEEEQPERMLESLELKPGMVVADVGAGVGYHSLLMARMVGPKGVVIATDVQPQMLSMLRANARQAGVRNIKTVLCNQDDPGLPEAAVDLILMVDVYHECSDPVATLKGLHEGLKPGGRLVLVEFRAEDPAVPIKPEHKMTVEQVRKEIEPEGFTFKEVLDFLPWQHIIIFEKLAEGDGKPTEGEAKPTGKETP